MSFLDQLLEYLQKPTVAYSLAGVATLVGLTTLSSLVVKARKITWPVAGKVFIVTGASSGIGKECAILLAKRGAQTAELLEQVAVQCRAHGARVVSVVADVSREEDCNRIVSETVKEFSQIDGLILNAGISMAENFKSQVNTKAFDQLFKVNFFQCVWMCHAALPFLEKTRGRIVNVSSVAGKAALPGRTAYCSSKNAMVAFFDCLRMEVLDAGIKITTVCPGLIATDIASRRVSSDGSVGKVGEADLDVSRGISAEACAVQMIDAMQAGEREIYPNAPTNMTFLGLVRLLFPEQYDKMAIAAVKKMSVQSNKSQ